MADQPTFRVTEPIDECPACHGAVWDNRGTKRNPKQPDFKCKDKDGCGAGVWIDEPKKEKAKPTAKQTGGAKQGFSAGPPLPGEEAPAAAAPAAPAVTQTGGPSPRRALTKEERDLAAKGLADLMVWSNKVIVERVVSLYLNAKPEPIGVTDDTVGKLATSLFIAAERRGCA